MPLGKSSNLLKDSDWRGNIKVLLCSWKFTERNRIYREEEYGKFISSYWATLSIIKYWKM